MPAAPPYEVLTMGRSGVDDRFVTAVPGLPTPVEEAIGA